MDGPTMPSAGRRLEIVVLGAGPAFTDRAGAAGAAYLVRSEKEALLLDLGQGAFPRLAATIEPADVAAVVISHLHPDHFVDLVPLRHHLRYHLAPPRRMRVIGPDGLAERLDALHGQRGFCAESLDIEAIREPLATVGSFALESGRVAHSADSHAFRISIGDGPGLVYSGDCAAIADLLPLVRPGDALLVEASFGVGPVPVGAMHLDAGMVRELVDRSRPARVLVTHVLPGMDRAATVERIQRGFDGLVEMVQPGFRTSLRA